MRILSNSELIMIVDSSECENLIEFTSKLIDDYDYIITIIENL